MEVPAPLVGVLQVQVHADCDVPVQQRGRLYEDRLVRPQVPHERVARRVQEEQAGRRLGGKDVAEEAHGVMRLGLVAAAGDEPDR